MTTSPRKSWEGYDFGTALYRNKDALKALLIILSGYSYFAGFEWGVFLTSLAVTALALIGKLALDAVDYYFSEVELEA